jgi:uncharacterized protein YecT (DUF1311 family)
MRVNLLVLVSVLVSFSWGSVAIAQTREFCRNSADEKQMIQCIEKGVYDPCDDASGSSSWWSAQCAWAHNSIAEGKIRKSEREISKRLHGTPEKTKALSVFRQSQKHWRQFRHTYCQFTNTVNRFEEFDGDSSFHVGYCLSRLAQDRAKELEMILRRDEQR